ncbi:ABC transporter substrate-binding protein [Microbispora sp. H11081]|uniref:ABC transporter substrate-binding protein n=1 Tax=Microbispora sp. H11081 TaxID=2729107 RepID=UPI001475AA72|nr:ABC transporter substrate-binding protein [Microbispora sp. H11081]
MDSAPPGDIRVADPHAVIEALVRRPFFWRPDRALPLVLVVGRDGGPFDAARRLAAPFEDSLPHATVRAGEHDTLDELVAALAGEHGQLGKPVGGSFLPPPRFPLVQFVLWARRQRDEPSPGVAWPPDPRSRTGQEEFKDRLKDWRRGRYGGDRGRRTAADFLGRAATTWVPVGTLAAWWLGGSSDLVGLIPWALGVLVAVIGTAIQAMLSIRGSFFNGWFGKQPYLTRKRFERLPKYALRIAGASDAEVERLLVHALCQDLRQAYQKWLIPWPSWGRGLYAMLVLDARWSGDVNERFLRTLEETVEETGLLPPLLVLAAVPESFAPGSRPVTAGPLADLPALVTTWRTAARRRVPPLRLMVRAPATPPDDDYRPRLLGSRMRAIGYWCVMALLLIGPVVLLGRIQQDRNAHCGGLSWVERTGGECVGVVNADGPAPGGLFSSKEITELVARIDHNNALAREAGTYVSVVLFGEYSVAQDRNDSAFVGARAELTAVEEYQRGVSGAPRLQVLVANAGTNFQQGRRTAELVSEMAAEDPRVLGVIGFQRSVRGVKEAIGTLHEAKIPMLVTTATADRLGYLPDGAGGSGPGYPSPYVFRLGPSNQRQARLAARFAHDRLLDGVDRPSAVIVQDQTDDDDYTNNLADDYAEEAGAVGITVGDRVAYKDRGTGMDLAVSRACAQGPDLLLYAGRAADFLDFLRYVEGKDCGRAPIKVLAGDDVIKAVANSGAVIGDYRRVRVYYAALASRELWRGGAATPTGFVQSLLDARDPKHPNESDDNLILSYDAAKLFYERVNAAYRGGLPSRGDVLYQISLVSPRDRWNGSSGVISFGAAAHEPEDKAIAILRVNDSGGSEVAVRCGRLATTEPQDTREICRDLDGDAGERTATNAPVAAPSARPPVNPPVNPPVGPVASASTREEAAGPGR